MSWRIGEVRVSVVPDHLKQLAGCLELGAGGTGRGGSSASEPRPSERRKSAVVARNDGRPRLPKRGSASINFRERSVSITPLLSVARILLFSARVIGCS